jgi:sortase A
MDGRPDTRRRRAVVAIAAGVAAASLAIMALQAGAQPAPATPATAPTTAAPTTTTVPPTTTTVAPPAVATTLRTPEPPPADEYADEPHVVIGSIEIPRLGLDVPLNQGISLTSIDRGPSHWPGTALPGEIGNVVVAGHRVSKTLPFRHIDQLEPGDEVILTGEHGRFVYRVTEHEVVGPDGMHIVDQTYDATATLFACHPPGSDRYRYVVKLALDGEALPPGGPPLGRGEAG